MAAMRSRFLDQGRSQVLYFLPTQCIHLLSQDFPPHIHERLISITDLNILSRTSLQAFVE